MTECERCKKSRAVYRVNTLNPYHVTVADLCSPCYAFVIGNYDTEAQRLDAVRKEKINA